MIFHSKQRQFPTYLNEVMINETIAERVTTMKKLGVHLEENWTWETHLTSISKKLRIFPPLIEKKNSIFEFLDFYIIH